MTRDAAVAALCQPELASVVDLVCWVENGIPYAANHLGQVRWPDDQTREVVAGVDPIGSEDPMAFLPYAREVAAPSPSVSTENAYPYPAARIRSLFADPDRSPDLAVVHTPRHFFPEQGGHVGEHGSLDVIQSRAPFVLSGAGVRQVRDVALLEVAQDAIGVAGPFHGPVDVAPGAEVRHRRQHVERLAARGRQRRIRQRGRVQVEREVVGQRAGVEDV